MRKTFLWLEYTWMKYFRYFSSWNCHFHMPNLSKIKVSAERKETLFFFQLHLSVHFQFTACMTTRKSWFCNMKFYDFMSLKGLLHISSFLFLFAVNNFPNNSYAFHNVPWQQISTQVTVYAIIYDIGFASALPSW